MSSASKEKWRLGAVLKASMVATLINLAILEVWQQFVVKPLFLRSILDLGALIPLAILFSWIWTFLGLGLLVFIGSALRVQFARRLEGVLFFVLLGALIAALPALLDHRLYTNSPSGITPPVLIWAIFGAASALVFALLNLKRFGIHSNT